LSDIRSPKLSFIERVVAGLFWRLGRIGVSIKLYVTVREGEVQPDSELLNDTFVFCELTEDHIDDLLQLDSLYYTTKRLTDWFKEGKLCFGLRDGERLVAKMWCDLAEVNWDPAYRKLKPQEAYLFAAFSDPEYRGQNLAPTLRAACYLALRERGRSEFYSHSEYFNLPARRFKQKLGGIEEDLQIEIRLFNKWSRTIILRRFG
jgi:GNAT superfamily N-acetyltransferase